MAIGANLPTEARRNPLQTCEWAVEQLASIPGLHLRRVSRWYETRPLPVSDQPPFINGVALLAGMAEPEALLHSMHLIEEVAGRTRSALNAARTLDLDLLAMDRLVIRTSRLTLPHPRMQDRAFVLAPLCDVLPDWRHPVLGLSAEKFLSTVSDQAILAL